MLGRMVVGRSWVCFVFCLRCFLLQHSAGFVWAVAVLHRKTLIRRHTASYLPKTPVSLNSLSQNTTHQTNQTNQTNQTTKQPKQTNQSFPLNLTTHHLWRTQPSAVQKEKLPKTTRPVYSITWICFRSLILVRHPPIKKKLK